MWITPMTESESRNPDGLSPGLEDVFCEIHNLAALTRLGLIPKRPERVGIGGVAHQQARHVALKCRSNGFKGVLSIAALAALQHRQMAGRHVQARRELLQRESAVVTPLPDEGLSEFPGLGHDTIVQKVGQKHHCAWVKNYLL